MNNGQALVARGRRLLSRKNLWWNIAFVGVAVMAAPRLLPHLGALVGVGLRERAPDFSAVALNGAAISSASLRGHVVLVNVWATWCLPCRAEMPLLQAMYTRHHDSGLEIVGVSVDQGSAQSVAAFVAERGITYPIVMDRSLVDVLGGVQGYPTSFLIDRHGRVQHKVIGAFGPLSLEPAVRRLLAQSAVTP